MIKDFWVFLPDIVGITGVLMTLAAYFLLNIHKISAYSYVYTGMNALGSMLILYSLGYQFNLAALIMEIAWLLISVYGFYKARKIF